jgi:hypothetical protein
MRKKCINPQSSGEGFLLRLRHVLCGAVPSLCTLHLSLRLNRTCLYFAQSRVSPLLHDPFLTCTSVLASHTHICIASFSIQRNQSLPSHIIHVTNTRTIPPREAARLPITIPSTTTCLPCLARQHNKRAATHRRYHPGLVALYYTYIKRHPNQSCYLEARITSYILRIYIVYTEARSASWIHSRQRLGRFYALRKSQPLGRWTEA